MSPAPTPAPLTAHLGYWLRVLSNHVSQGFVVRLTGESTSVAEWVMLRLLHDGAGMAPSALAAQMGLTRGGVTKLADRLIARGLVARMADARDGRAQVLALTEAGRGLVPVLAALADENEAAAFGAMLPEDRAEFERLLRALVQYHGLMTAPLE